MASEGRRCGPLAESKRGRVWRRAGLEVEATPGPPLPQAQPRTTGLRGASSVLLSVAGCSRDFWDDPKRAPAGQNPSLTDVRRALLPVGGVGLCIKGSERAIVFLIIHEAHVRVLFNFNSKLPLACRYYKIWFTTYWMHRTSFSERQA